MYYLVSIMYTECNDSLSFAKFILFIYINYVTIYRYINMYKLFHCLLFK